MFQYLAGMQPRLRRVPRKGPSSTTATESPSAGTSEEISSPKTGPYNYGIENNPFVFLNYANSAAILRMPASGFEPRSTRTARRSEARNACRSPTA